jgi:hypothetical protein
MTNATSMNALRRWLRSLLGSKPQTERGAERRTGGDRRSGHDRRSPNGAPTGAERRSGTDRRSGQDRRDS